MYLYNWSVYVGHFLRSYSQHGIKAVESLEMTEIEEKGGG
jgi:hypothetical protein